MVVTAAAASEQVEVHPLFGRRREVRVVRRGVECAVIPINSELAVMRPKWLWHWMRTYWRRARGCYLLDEDEHLEECGNMGD